MRRSLALSLLATALACNTRNWQSVPTVADFPAAYPCTVGDHVAIWSDNLPMIADTSQQRIVSGKSALDHYPADQRLDHRAGTVRARFVIDTLGNVVPGSGLIEASSDDQYARAVCYALPRLKWEPVVVNGQKAVAGLVHVPFTFEVR